MIRRLPLLLVLLAGLLVVAGPEAPAAEPFYYSAFRVVRETPGTPSRPQVTLPAGYEVVPGAQYDVASRAEYYLFVRGPRADGIDVEVSWPDTPVRAVIWQKTRLTFTTAGDAVRFRLPVRATSLNALQPTLQIWSYPGSTPGADLRVEHNDPDRAVTWWAARPWAAGETTAVLHLLYASERVLADSGLAAETAARGHFFAVQGFETANTLHLDNPPHWHLTYVPGKDWSAVPVYLPHFWIDKLGKIFYNGMDVTGEGRYKYYAGDPAVLRLPDRSAVVTLTIRYDGGLDIIPPKGPSYSIVGAGPADRGLLDGVHVFKDGRLWRTVRVTDDTHAGVLRITEQIGIRKQVTVHPYDPLTGTLRTVS